MKLKIKKANKFYLVENDSEQQSPTQSGNDIFAIKKDDSKFLKNFKEYCKSAINNAEQPTDGNKPENTSTASENTPGEGKRETVDNAIAGLVDLAKKFVVNPNEGN